MKSISAQDSLKSKFARVSIATAVIKSISFLPHMGELIGDSRYFNTAVRLGNNFHNYWFDENYGLMSLCWHSDVNHPGAAFRGRANSRAMLAWSIFWIVCPRNIGTDAHVSLKIYDPRGQEAATLVNEKVTAGAHRIKWNAQNLASGFYFYKITMSACSNSQRMILLRYGN